MEKNRTILLKVNCKSCNCISTGWAKSHFTLLKANKTEPNTSKIIGYESNERPDLGVFFRHLVFHFNKMDQRRTQQEKP